LNILFINVGYYEYNFFTSLILSSLLVAAMNLDTYANQRYN